ncbi:MAG: TIGR00269 family protein [Candidatus Bathyarchaeota archaeon]|nr:MAG: TIGR00269 family protein [Candidatus Bathyarchaeota archaeon]
MRTTIAKHEMLRFDEKIAIGVSGGKDSMTLLHILNKLEKPFPKAKLVAITIDEGIEGYRNEAVRIAEKGCSKIEVAHVVVSFKESFGHSMDEVVQNLKAKDMDDKGLTPCAYCGVLRRRTLNSAARHVKATRLAVAHNLDDEIQTFLLNIFHGDLLRLARIEPASSSPLSSFVPRIKPLCSVLEREITLYAFLKKIDFQTTPCPYSHRALRNDIRAMLNRMEEKHPGLKYTTYRSGEKVRASVRDTMKTSEMRNCSICGEPSAADLCQTCKILRIFDSEKHSTQQA